MGDIITDEFLEEIAEYLRQAPFWDEINEDFDDEKEALMVNLNDFADKYATLTRPELEGNDLEEFKQVLKSDTENFHTQNVFNAKDIQSIDTIISIAFLRLAKASKEYHNHSQQSCTEEESKKYKVLAEKYNEDYKLLSQLR